MAEGRKVKTREPGEAHPPLLSEKQFEESPDFDNFKGIMRRLLSVPKSELDGYVKAAKQTSPRTGNPDAAGREKTGE